MSQTPQQRNTWAPYSSQMPCSPPVGLRPSTAETAGGLRLYGAQLQKQKILETEVVYNSFDDKM